MPNETDDTNIITERTLSGRTRKVRAPSIPKPKVRVDPELASLYFSDLGNRLCEHIVNKLAYGAKTYTPGSPQRMTYAKLGINTGLSEVSVHRVVSSRSKPMTLDIGDNLLRAMGMTITDLLRNKERSQEVPLAEIAALYLQRMDDALVALASFRASVPMDRTTRRRSLALVGGLVECVDALYTLLGVERSDVGIVAPEEAPNEPEDPTQC